MSQVSVGKVLLSVKHRVITALVVGMVIAGCGSSSADDGPADLPSADQLRSAPYAEGVDVDASYSYVVDTHCGVEWALIDGDWWTTEPLNDGNANPPPGWGNPAESGQMTIVNDDLATFEADNGMTIQFTRTDARDREPCE